MNSDIKILVLEDELLLAKDLQGKLEDFGYHVEHVRSGEETLKAFQKDIPDLAVLDIEVEGEMDGLEIGSYITNTYGTPIIYLTQFKDLQTFQKAKKAKPVSYLTKPVNLWDLIRAIELSLEHAAIATNVEEKNYVLSKAIYLKSEEQHFEKVSIDDIYYLKAAGAYTEIHTTTKTFIFSDNISYFEKKLMAPQLMRVHRSWMINVNRVDSIDKSNLVVHDEKIPVGKSYKKTVQATFKLIS